MEMNVPDFLDNFIMSEMDIEVHIVMGKNNSMIYIGSPANFDAFIKHMKHFKDTEVFSVSVSDNGRLVICAS